MNPARFLPLPFCSSSPVAIPNRTFCGLSRFAPRRLRRPRTHRCQVKNQALLDFASIGKQCEPFAVQTFVQNKQETVWKACCYDKTFNYAIYYPAKCVVRKVSGPVDCTPN